MVYLKITVLIVILVIGMTSGFPQNYRPDIAGVLLQSNLGYQNPVGSNNAGLGYNTAIVGNPNVGGYYPGVATGYVTGVSNNAGFGYNTAVVGTPNAVGYNQGYATGTYNNAGVGSNTAASYQNAGVGYNNAAGLGYNNGAGASNNAGYNG